MIEFFYARLIVLIAAIAVSSTFISSGIFLSSDVSETRAESVSDRLLEAIDYARLSTSNIFEVSLEFDFGYDDDFLMLLNDSEFIISIKGKMITYRFQCDVSIVPEEIKNRYFPVSGTTIIVRGWRESPVTEPQITIEIIT